MGKRTKRAIREAIYYGRKLAPTTPATQRIGRDGGGCLYPVIQRKTAASVVQGFKSGELNWRGASMDYTPDSANRSST